jgi:hypothetical protein
MKEYSWYIDTKGNYNIVSDINTSKEFLICIAYGEHEANLVTSALNAQEKLETKLGKASDRLAWGNGEIIDEYEHPSESIKKAEQQ